MWTMAETEEGRRRKRDSLAAAVGEDDGLELEEDEAGEGASPRGLWTEMALRKQLSHCCLWKTSLTCSVCDCAWPGSCERTRKMFLAVKHREEEELKKSALETIESLQHHLFTH